MAESKLMEKYPFLSDIWNSYNFDNPMVYSTDNLPILVLCDENETYKTSPTEKHKNVCKDLLKNLKILSNYSYIDRDTFFTGCKNLNNWLYFKEKELNVSSDIINKIFQAFNQIENVNYHFLECPYSTFDKEFNETERLINLRIFNNNIETIQSLLKSSDKSNDCNLKKYIYECVDIYNIMKETHRFPQDCTHNLHKNACEIINDFNKLYLSYIYKKDGILHNFPDLSSNTITNIIDGCQSPENTTESTSGEPPQTGTSMREVVSPALGVMAGIPPFLALIYNFTPVRKFLSFKNKKNARAFSNLGEEVENELIIEQLDDASINSVHPKYNVAYGQI